MDSPSNYRSWISDCKWNFSVHSTKKNVVCIWSCYTHISSCIASFGLLISFFWIKDPIKNQANFRHFLPLECVRQQGNEEIETEDSRQGQPKSNQDFSHDRIYFQHVLWEKNSNHQIKNNVVQPLICVSFPHYSFLFSFSHSLFLSHFFFLTLILLKIRMNLINLTSKS